MAKLIQDTSGAVAWGSGWGAAAWGSGWGAAGEAWASLESGAWVEASAGGLAAADAM